MSEPGAKILLNYKEPHTQVFNHKSFDKAGISVSVLREDLNHPFVSGNKWWKLRDNLKSAIDSGKPVLTFGGPFSNHIYATAAACRELNIPCTGIIRGEPGPIESPTLKFAANCGMRLMYISRVLYSKKEEVGFFDLINIATENYFIIPEGGTSEIAVNSCADWGKILREKYSGDFDSILLSAGTGGTAAGLIAGIKGEMFVHVFSSLKSGSFLEEKINKWISNYVASQSGFEPGFKHKWRLHLDFHFGGYGKSNPDVLNFIKSCNDELPLDSVYTAKMILGIIQLAETGAFSRGSRLLAIHSGGLQGNAGFLI